MSSFLEALPKTGRLEVDIKVTADINISSYAAKQKVDSFILSEISYMMHAGDPSLVVDNNIYWRIPVMLSSTSKGDLGQAGVIDVDVETGQLQVTPQLISEINTHAKGLAISSASASTE